MENQTLLFKRLMENAPESVFFKDLESRFIAINQSCARKFGLNSPDEALGKTDFDFFAIEHAQNALEDEHQILATLEPIVNKEEREVFNDADRTVAWTTTSKFPLINEEGVLIGTYGITKDITRRKKNFEEIRRLKEQVESILNAVPSMILVKDYEGKYVMANKSAREYFNPYGGEIIGKKDVDLGVPHDRAEKYLEIDHKVIKSQEPSFNSEEKTRRWDGKEFWHQTTKVPFTRADNGEPVVLSVITDVSKRVKYEVELVDSLNTISKQNERLSNFAHIVSHNLRNHAGGISMLISLLEESEDDAEKEELFDLLTKSSERLNETIADLNEIIDNQSKVETELKKISFEETLAGIKEVLQTEIRKNDVWIEEEIEPGMKFKYSPAYLESILLNLLSNAIKYRSSKRRPHISIRAWKEQGRVQLVIQDNGMGIDLEKFGNKVFGMYKTFHNNDNAKGIGLYITKNQIESLGGSIHIESVPDQGTTFHVDFGKQHRNRMLVPA